MKKERKAMQKGAYKVRRHDFTPYFIFAPHNDTNRIPYIHR